MRGGGGNSSYLAFLFYYGDTDMYGELPYNLQQKMSVSQQMIIAVWAKIRYNKRCYI